MSFLRVSSHRTYDRGGLAFSIARRAAGFCKQSGDFVGTSAKHYKAEIGVFHLQVQIIPDYLLVLTAKHSTNHVIDAWQGVEPASVDDTQPTALAFAP